MKNNYNYHNLLTMDLKPIFDLEKNEELTNINVTNLLEQVSKDLDIDKENIVKKIKEIKSKSALLDFIYFHNYRVNDLKLQFSKKISMKKKIVKSRFLKKENIKEVDKEFIHKISNRFKFNILEIDSVEYGFEILHEIRNIVDNLLDFIKLEIKKIIKNFYQAERIHTDLEITLQFINMLRTLKIAKNEKGNDISKSEMIKIMRKSFILRKSNGYEYSEKSINKIISDTYVHKKKKKELDEFRKKVHEFKLVMYKNTYIKGIRKDLIKKIQN
uniref:hypothetical protein n=1 Tax=Sphingomonas sp. TaxID=28214 RepID=UPI0025D4DB96|nr:hypothetical protein [Sphingomonas sp.]